MSSRPKPSATSPSLHTILILAFVGIATLPALWGGFLYDDVGLISSRADLIQSSGGLSELVSHQFWWNTPGTATKDNLFRPWVTFTYWLEWHLGGGSPFLFHFSNWLVHLANVGLVLAFLAPFFGFGRAAAVAGIFGVTPAAMTSIGWIAGRTDLWAMFFSLLFLLAFRIAGERRDMKYLIAANLSFFLALCSKESAIIAPLLVWIFDFAKPRDPSQKQASQPLWHFATLILPLAVFLLLRNAVVAGSTVGLSTALVFERLPFLAEKVVRSALHVLLPIHYNFFSEYLWSEPAQRSLGFAVVWIVFIAATAAVLIGFFRRLTWTTGGLWFGLVLMPVYLLGQSFAPIADFYAYMGIPGLWLMVIIGGAMLLKRFGGGSEQKSYNFTYALGSLIVIFGILMFVRLPILRTEISLMSHMVKREPNSAMAMTRLAGSYLAQNNPAEAVHWYEQAVKLKPTGLEARRNLAELYLDARELKQAAPHIDALAAQGGGDLQSQAAVARFYYLANQCTEAVAFYRRAFALGAPSPDLLYDYGLSLFCTKENQEAIKVFREVVRLAPDWPQAYQNLGIAFERVGQWSDAATAYGTAVRLDPRLAVGWESLAIANLPEIGNRAEAERAAQAYFQLNPPPDRAARLREQIAAAGK